MSVRPMIWTLRYRFGGSTLHPPTEPQMVNGAPRCHVSSMNPHTL